MGGSAKGVEKRVVASHRGRFDRTSVLILVAALGLVVPALVDLSSAPKRRAFGWVAADAFYYLTVARNIVRHGHIAYDQTHPSNGFHPLWQMLSTAVAAIFDGPSTEGALVLALVAVGLAVTAMAVPLLAWGLAATGRRLSMLFPLLPVGAYAILILPVWARAMPSLAKQNLCEGPMPIYGTLWSWANGMESCLVVFFLALAGWIFALGDVRTSRGRACALGLALSGLVLSRLDHVLLVMPLVGGLAISLIATRGWTEPLTLFLAVFFAPIALYVLANHHYYGVLIPTSGALKSSFPHVENQNLDDLASFWAGPWRGVFLWKAYRQFPAVIPALVALLYLAVVLDVRPRDQSVLVRLRSWTSRYDAFLVLLAPGVVLLALYNVLFVGWGNQGHWYFPASTLFVSLVVLSLSAPLEEQIADLLRPPPRRLGPRTASALWSLWLASSLAIVSLVFVRFHRQLDYHRVYADFYFLEAPRVRAHYGSEMPRFVEADDGIVAYSLGAPTMSVGMGLDPEAAAVLARSGDLLDLALRRGHDRLTSLVYATGDSLGKNPSTKDVRNWARAVITFDDTKPYDFALDYLSADGHFAIVKAWKN